MVCLGAGAAGLEVFCRVPCSAAPTARLGWDPKAHLVWGWGAVHVVRRGCQLQIASQPNPRAANVGGRVSSPARHCPAPASAQVSAPQLIPLRHSLSTPSPAAGAANAARMGHEVGRQPGCKGSGTAAPPMGSHVPPPPSVPPKIGHPAPCSKTVPPSPSNRQGRSIMARPCTSSAIAVVAARSTSTRPPHRHCWCQTDTTTTWPLLLPMPKGYCYTLAMMVGGKQSKDEQDPAARRKRALGRCRPGGAPRTEKHATRSRRTRHTVCERSGGWSGSGVTRQATSADALE